MLTKTALPQSIAILDDDLDLLELMEQWLLDAGYTVKTCSSSGALARVLSRRRYDLLILDFHLPGMSGVELIRTLRSEWSIETPCVVVSADADQAAKKEAMQKGASAFLGKPFDKQLLLNTIASYLPTDT